MTKTAAELSQSTGKKCIPAQADVRQPKTLQEAVTKTIHEFGRIDYVICGEYYVGTLTSRILTLLKGAAGNFLATIDGMSENAFRTVIEIDTVSSIHSSL